jgi:4,5-DOPA dioxygenase extradiol
MTMTASMPVLFLSHESPMMWDTESPARTFLTALAPHLPQPKAILVISAHWITSAPRVSGATQPATIHDFGGFPEHYYKVVYPAAGAPDVAARAAALLQAAGFESTVDPERGMDHAVWLPVGLAWPSANVPVVSLSVQPRKNAAHHFKIGQALAPLREEGVLIVGSGTTTHNLRAFFSDRPPGLNDPPSESARGFTEWLKVHISNGETLLRYREEAPFASTVHPTTEHFMPLMVAAGAGSGSAVRLLHESYSYSHFAMCSFAWG